MKRLVATPLFALLGALVLLAGACGDGETDADPTPPLGDDDTNATVPRDNSGAIGEDGEDDSQTDVGRLDEDVVPTSGTARVVGDFGGSDLELLLTEDARCEIREAPEAGDEPAAEVSGETEDGTRFTLDWSVSVGELTSTLEVDGTTWTAAPPVNELDEQVIRLTRNGEVYLETSYESGGEVSEALFYVNCRPDT